MSSSERTPHTTATQLTQAILKAISAKYYPECLCWRQNVTVARLATKYGSRPVRSAPNGTADIIGCIKGLPVAIEVKVGKDRLSESQINWRDAWVKSGGVYIVAREFEEVMRDLGDVMDRRESIKQSHGRWGW